MYLSIEITKSDDHEKPNFITIPFLHYIDFSAGRGSGHGVFEEEGQESRNSMSTVGYTIIGAGSGNRQEY